MTVFRISVVGGVVALISACAAPSTQHSVAAAGHSSEAAAHSVTAAAMSTATVASVPLAITGEVLTVSGQASTAVAEEVFEASLGPGQVPCVVTNQASVCVAPDGPPEL